jgi:phosphoenolpyruvate synthase/pyruvate phosphate dikinase
LVAAVVLDHGSIHRGIPAAGGIGAGVRFHVDHTAMVSKPPQRAVITSPHAPPNLSQLVWDAAGLVTHGGSASAHLFESARSLGVPAVCGVEPGADRDQIIAVDGHSGLVATLPLSSDP